MARPQKCPPRARATRRSSDLVTAAPGSRRNFWRLSSNRFAVSKPHARVRRAALASVSPSPAPLPKGTAEPSHCATTPRVAWKRYCNFRSAAEMVFRFTLREAPRTIREPFPLPWQGHAFQQVWHGKVDARSALLAPRGIEGNPSLRVREGWDKAYPRSTCSHAAPTLRSLRDRKSAPSPHGARYAA